MKRKLHLLFLMLSLLSTFNVPMWAAALSDHIVKGIVIDESGLAVIGASISEKGTKNGAITDMDGKFTLRIEDYGHTLEVSYIGYATQSVQAEPGKDLRIVLKEDAETLDEVVIVGYQVMRKTDVVGAVSSVKANELNVTTPTVGQSLVGKVSGVQISQVTGAPYGNTKIRVRGVASINASSDPLYVIDGYPSNDDLMLNPEDIVCHLLLVPTNRESCCIGYRNQNPQERCKEYL